MKNYTYKLLLILIAANLMACAKSNDSHDGYIAGLSIEESANLQASGAKLEVLDSEKSLYVVRGLSETEITQIAPNKQITKNTIFKIDPKIRNQAVLDWDEIEDLDLNPDYEENVSDHSEEPPTDHFDLIGVREAQKISDGNETTIAVIDTGVDYNHPDLNSNIFLNKSEIPNNGIDDDNNGLIDDYTGFDFVNDDPLPFDDHGHGSHVAGLAASKKMGIAPKAKILPIKVMSWRGEGSLSTIYKGIQYAIKRNAKIINLSFGGDTPTDMIVKMLFFKARLKGILIVNAAGNSDFDNDLSPGHFTALDGANVVSVMAVNSLGNKSSYSSFGKRTTTLAAPGGDLQEDLVSVMPEFMGGYYQEMSGTSMASPVVAGIAALVSSANPNLSALDIKRILVSTVQKKTEFAEMCSSSGIIDAAAAVKLAKNSIK